MADTIMVAYSFNVNNRLLNVSKELEAIHAVVKRTSCSFEPSERDNQEELENRIARLKAKIMVFHYAGHAGGAVIELNNGFGEMSFINMEVFAKIMALDAPALRLVFLNGCSTREQSQFLLDQGIPAVISTEFPVDDNYAYAFAKRFYEVFLDSTQNYTLEAAFEKAKLSLKARSLGKEVVEGIPEPALNPVHPAKRGNIAFEQEDQLNIYQLKGKAEVLSQRLTDWLPNAKQERPPAETPLDQQSTTKPSERKIRRDDAYLLCDRRSELRTLRDLLRAKLNGQQPSPSFVFIKGRDEDCMLYLMERLEKYLLPEMLSNFRSEAIPFPLPEDFDKAAGPEKSLLTLENDIRSGVQRPPRQQAGQQAEQGQTGKQFLLLYHKIFKPFWKPRIESLFEHYIGNFSNELEQYGAGVVVFILLMHSDKPEVLADLKDFSEMYQRLKHKYGDRVVFFNSLPQIELSDLREWYDMIIGGTLDPFDYDIECQEMFYQEASRYMKKIIKANPESG